MSDEELFKKVQEGSKDAMELIIRRYYKDIFRYIYNKIKDYHTAQDLCQEVFCKVYERRDTYSSEYLLKPWIYKVSYNYIIDYTRRKEYNRRQGLVSLDDNIRDKNNSIEYKLFNNNIDDFVEELTEVQKEVVKLRFCEQLSIEDIAIVTGNNINTIKSRLYKSIKNIKNKLKNKKRGCL